MKRKEPRWVVPFLRALERTGEVRVAAKDAGIDHSTAYARRKAHGEFADAWAAALEAHGARVKAEEEAEIGALRSGRTAPSPGSPPASPTSPPERGRGEELVVSGGKVRRVGRERWGKGKEAIFFEELAATANATLAAEAAGVSTNAVFARRLKHPLFRAKWEAVVRTAKASIDLYLIEETRKAFDPGTIDYRDRDAEGHHRPGNQDQPAQWPEEAGGAARRSLRGRCGRDRRVRCRGCAPAAGGQDGPHRRVRAAQAARARLVVRRALRGDGPAGLHPGTRVRAERAGLGRGGLGRRERTAPPAA